MSVKYQSEKWTIEVDRELVVNSLIVNYNELFTNARKIAAELSKSDDVEFSLYNIDGIKVHSAVLYTGRIGSLINFIDLENNALLSGANISTVFRFTYNPELFLIKNFLLSVSKVVYDIAIYIPIDEIDDIEHSFSRVLLLLKSENSNIFQQIEDINLEIENLSNLLFRQVYRRNAGDFDDSLFAAINKDYSFVSTSLQRVQELYKMRETKIKLEEDLQKTEILKDQVIRSAEEIDTLKSKLADSTQRLSNEEIKLNELFTKRELLSKVVDFDILARSCKKTSYVWASIASMFFVGLICFLLSGMHDTSSFTNVIISVRKMVPGNSVSQDLFESTIYFTYYKLLVTKVVFYSLFVFIVVVCIKNYNAQQHNYLIYAHKVSTLGSVQTLLASPETPEVRDQLVMHAATAIFSHQNTGYSSNDQDVQSPNFITNVIDGLAKKA